jgi:small subunit ribosomal protein S3
MAVDELLSKEFEEAGYGGITLTKTPLGAQINLYTMRPGRVIGKRGRAIKDASEKLEKKLGLVNPQITVVEIEVPELNPHIMAARVANALERGVHFRRSIFWSLRRIMDSGALGCEIILKGPIRSARARFEKVSEGYIPKAGEPSKRWLRHATIHVKQKRGILGVTVNIIPPDAKFPDKISLKDLPEIEYPEEEVYMPEGVEPDVEELPSEEPVTQTTEQPEAIVETPTEVKTEEVVEEPATVQAELETQPVEEKVEEEPKTEADKPDEGKEEN